MTTYFIATYDVSDPERFADYTPGSGKEIVATITEHGGRVLASGPSDVTVGSAPGRVVLISFPDAESAKAWQGDEGYAPLKAIRYEATTNITELIVEGF